MLFTSISVEAYNATKSGKYSIKANPPGIPEKTKPHLLGDIISDIIYLVNI